MTFKGYTISARIIGLIVAAILLIVSIGLFVRSCDARHSRAAQSRLDAAQGQAKADSSKDAIDTVSRSGERSAASEELSRANEQEIKAAPGASDRVNAGVDSAGRRALCRRDAYKDTPQCKKP